MSVMAVGQKSSCAKAASFTPCWRHQVQMLKPPAESRPTARRRWQMPVG